MSAKSTVGIGIIGTGFARTTQLPAFRACEGARVVGVASGHRENAERVAREFDVPFATGDWRELVAREDVDLVSIVTPPSTHEEMTLAAHAAGKAVLCEKPLAMNFEEAARMRDAARGAGLFAHVDHELRFLPARRRMREMVLAGEVGEVWHARVEFRAGSRADASRTWDWWSDAASGGGVLGAIGSHAVDSLHFLTGARTLHVAASLATHVRQRPDPQTGEPRPVETDDEANLLIHFADGETTAQGATASASMSVVEAGEPMHVVEVFGARGALRTDGTGGLWRAEAGAREWSSVETDASPLAEGMGDNEWSRGFTVFARRIVEALARGGRAARVEGAATFDDGYQIQRVLDAARDSHASGCRVTITE